MEKDKTLAFPKGKAPDQFTNRLFFQARNLAIEAMLLRLDTLFMREGFNVQSGWHEISFSTPTIEIRLYNTKPDSWEYAKCTLEVSRERITAPESASDLYYRLKSVHPSEYWPRKQPVHVLAFRERVEALEKEGHFARELDKVNYPFDAKNFSSF